MASAYSLSQDSHAHSTESDLRPEEEYSTDNESSPGEYIRFITTSKESFQAQVKRLRSRLKPSRLRWARVVLAFGEQMVRVWGDYNAAHQSFVKFMIRKHKRYKDLGVQLHPPLSLSQRASLNSQQFRHSVTWYLAVEPSPLIPRGSPAPSFRFPDRPLKKHHWAEDPWQIGLKTSLWGRRWKKVPPLFQQMCKYRLEWAVNECPVDTGIAMLLEMLPSGLTVRSQYRRMSS